ncbi:thialysine N-epsilon-acetyltransferase-like [Eublepharis macularius]|uniref:Thialysine N-epsilon-acetyltransferase-like n=1 Tax=Eublepharis macularius TaxID=481883 RepID=A0AA97KA06_EUBMA|nr:thialysine N-epsilon-acetyltransferase-like [Eublepharis macularius]
MSYIIRPWALTDLKAIMRLIRESASFHKALDQVKTTPEMLRDDGFGKEATFGCLVAEAPPEQTSKEGDTIVGYQFHYLTYCTWDGHILFGEDLYVRPDFRGKGIGSSLLAKAAKIALAKGCSQLRFISANWNQPATDFYTRLGAVNVTSRDKWNLCCIDKEDLQKLVEQARK